jgi:hypothetical protein
MFTSPRRANISARRKIMARHNLVYGDADFRLRDVSFVVFKKLFEKKGFFFELGCFFSKARFRASPKSPLKQGDFVESLLVPGGADFRLRDVSCVVFKNLFEKKRFLKRHPFLYH